MSWADLTEDSNVSDALKAVDPTVIVEEEGDANAVLAMEKLKKIDLNKDAEKDIDRSEVVAESLHNGKVSVKNAETGEETMYEVSTAFDELGLKPELLQAVYEKGFKRPSMIQAAAIPRILKGENVIAQAHHGSGKTATFVLSMLSVVDVTKNSPQAICLCNTRELAVQILEVAQELGKYINATAYMAVKGVKYEAITQHIVVGTPGAVRQRIGKQIPNMSDIKIVVFDEADVLVNENDGYTDRNNNSARGGRGGARGGRGGARGGKTSNAGGDGLVAQASEVRKACKNAQILLFSATFSDEVLEFAKHAAEKAALITLQKDKLALDNIVQLTIECLDVDDKLDQLVSIYENIDTKQSIIFCNSVFNAKSLCNQLRTHKINVSLIYGKLEDTQRELAVRDFREGRTKVLISTNLLSRGLDVPAVSLVVNYDIPMKPVVGKGDCPDPDTYMHRIGRSGRFGRAACAINLTYDDVSKKAVKSIEEEYSKPTLKVARDDIDTLETIVTNALKGIRPDEKK